MSKIVLTTIVITAVAIMAAACTGTPYLYSKWGESVETAKKLQVVNPQAGSQPVADQEMNGTAAGQALESYQKSFKPLEVK